MKGIYVDIYKHKGQSCSNGGISTHSDEAILLMPDHAGGYVEPSPTIGGWVMIVRRPIGDYAVPCNNLGEPLQKPDQCGPMFGGTFIYSSDSRFREYAGSQPIALHDRWESEELNRMLSI